MTPTKAISDLIEYFPNWKSELKFFVDEENWPRVRPFFEYYRATFDKSIRFNLLGHTQEPRDGARFGSTDLSVDQKLFEWFGLESEPDTQPTRVKAAQPTNHARGEDHHNSRYPWHLLKEVGDYFIVTGSKAKRFPIQVAHRNKAYPSHHLTSRTLSDGSIIVFLYEIDDELHKNVVHT